MTRAMSDDKLHKGLAKAAPSILVPLILLFIVSCAKAPSAPAPKIDADEAFSLVEKAVSFGPRASGSEGARRMAEWIAAEAKSCKGFDVRTMEFEEGAPGGNIRFRNVVAKMSGTDSSRYIVVGAHYDTKRLASAPDFQGANDGGSGAGVLLAMMKALSRDAVKPPVSLRFVFFDGEECLYGYSESDGLHGSRRLVKEWKSGGELKSCAAMILLDMVGDSDLCVSIPTGSDRRLAGMTLAAAERLGCGRHFKMHHSNILDDHTPFQREGVPAIDLIDFEFGPGNIYWHTRADSMDKISKDSLKIAGDMAFELLWLVASDSGFRR